jgi:hypothetical protein
VTGRTASIQGSQTWQRLRQRRQDLVTVLLRRQQPEARSAAQ